MKNRIIFEEVDPKDLVNGQKYILEDEIGNIFIFTYNSKDKKLYGKHGWDIRIPANEIKNNYYTGIYRKV